MSGSCPLYLGERLQNAETFNWLCLSSAQRWLSPRSAHGCVKQSADTNEHIQFLKQNMFQGNNTDSKNPDLPNGIFPAKRWLTQPTDAIRVENKECWYEGCFWEEGEGMSSLP